MYLCIFENEKNCAYYCATKKNSGKKIKKQKKLLIINYLVSSIGSYYRQIIKKRYVLYRVLNNFTFTLHLFNQRNGFLIDSYLYNL